MKETKVDPSQQGKKISFRSKDNTKCPACGADHQKEQLFQGGGRLIAGNLTKDLRRIYEKNKKFGRVNPNDYVINVCPKCLYASFPKDWALSQEDLPKIKNSAGTRRTNIEKILGTLDFAQDRNLPLGAASYLLAIDCYQQRGVSVAPTPKKGVSAIKGAWYFDDLHSEFPSIGYDKVRDLLYRKATVWYASTLEMMQAGPEPVDIASQILGPDTDNNWGFDGVIYLNSYLTMKYKEQLAHTPEKQLDLLVKAKRSLAKLYGGGKASKSKPSAILELAKETYDEMNSAIEAMGGEK
jgi:uncharacterized protein (DUF2225 family)